jgi:uncharacterized integral membrane protein
MFSKLLISLIISSWLILIAVFSIQNITPVSLSFLFFKSINIPVGVLLTMFGAMGIVLGSVIPFLLISEKSKYSSKSQPKKQTNYTYNRQEVEEEEDPLFNWD